MIEKFGREGSLLNTNKVPLAFARDLIMYDFKKVHEK